MSCCRPAVLPPAAHAALGIGPCVVLAHGRRAERRAGLQVDGSGGLGQRINILSTKFAAVKTCVNHGKKVD